MLKKILLFSIITLFIVNDTYAEGNKYETTIASGTIFLGNIFAKNKYPILFRGFVRDTDSITVSTKDVDSFLKSVYFSSKFIAQGWPFFDKAYKLIFGKSPLIRISDNDVIDVLQDYNLYYDSLCDKHEKTVTFALDTGETVSMSYYNIGSCFVVFPIDLYYDNNFSTSDDFDLSAIPSIDCIWVPIGAFCSFRDVRNVFVFPHKK